MTKQTAVTDTPTSAFLSASTRPALHHHAFLGLALGFQVVEARLSDLADSADGVG